MQTQREKTRVRQGVGWGGVGLLGAGGWLAGDEDAEEGAGMGWGLVCRKPGQAPAGGAGWGGVGCGGITGARVMP